MIQVFCTCNGTLPLTEAGLRQWADPACTILLVDHLCSDWKSILKDISSASGPLFIGCNHKESFFAAMEEDGSFMTPPVCFPINTFCQSFQAPEIDRLAAAYARVSIALSMAERVSGPRSIPVGPTLLFAGDLDTKLVRTLERYFHLLWVSESGEYASNKVSGKLVSLEGSLGNFRATVELNGQTQLPQSARCRLQVQERNLLTFSADQVIAPGVQLPERPGLFLPKAKDELLAAIMGALALAQNGVTETFSKVRIAKEICCHSHADQTGCTKCLRSCPSNALSSDQGTIQINHDYCVGCQSCTTACPSGALSARPLSANALGEIFIQFVQEVADIAPLALICGDCSEKVPPPEGHIGFAYPQMSLIETSHILGALSFGAQTLSLLPCSCCQKRVSKSQILAEEILKRVEMDKRLSWMQPASPTSTNHIPWKGPKEPAWSSKRHNLAKFLEPIVTTTSGQFPPLEGPFGHVIIDESLCTGCGACYTACSTDALSADLDTMTLFCKDILCIACGLCVSVCPENAIRIQGGLRWNKDVFDKRKSAASEGFACKKCGKIFATKRAIESVLDRLTGRLDPKQEAVLHYCPDCRVIVSLTGLEDV